MKAYSEYKESGVETVTQIPKHWEIGQVKYFCNRITKGTTPTTFGKSFVDEGIRFIKVECITEKMSIDQNMCGFIDEETHEILKRSQLIEGNVVIAIAGAIGRVAIVPKELLPANTNQAVGILTPNEKVINPNWLAYSLSAESSQKYFGLSTVQSAQANISLENLGLTHIPLPSLPEQQAIADFLDRKTAQIDTLIEKKQRQIELLQEQRTALINHAVTKGLNPNVKMKDSGVEWLGEIPSHWEVVKLKYIGKAFIGLTYNPENVTDEENGTLVFRASNVQEGKIVFDDNVYVKMEIPERLITKVGDILICVRSGSRDLIGKNALIDEKSAGHTFGAFMTVFRSDINYFLSYVLSLNYSKFNQDYSIPQQ